MSQETRPSPSTRGTPKRGCLSACRSLGGHFEDGTVLKVAYAFECIRDGKMSNLSETKDYSLVMGGLKLIEAFKSCLFHPFYRKLQKEYMECG